MRKMDLSCVMFTTLVMSNSIE